MRKALRRPHGSARSRRRRRADALVGEVEVVPNPAPDGGHRVPGRVVVGEEGIREMERNLQRLVWRIKNDTWAHYVVRCCLCHHNVVRTRQLIATCIYYART
ncbi:hypothetical protein EI94DRAFT_325048 [Lactarius quietus]|nr:hypothetical protein EI94DRAFT_325048 [Lactarius quietus]